MSQATLADHIDSFCVPQNADIHSHVKPIGTVFQFFVYALPLPAIPIRHMGKPRLAAHCAKRPGFRQLIGLAAAFAGNGHAFALHFTLLQAVGAFVKHPVQMISSERLCDLQCVLLLPTEIVEGKAFFEHGRELVGGFFRNLVRR